MHGCVEITQREVGDTTSKDGGAGVASLLLLSLCMLCMLCSIFPMNPRNLGCDGWVAGVRGLPKLEFRAVVGLMVGQTPASNALSLLLGEHSWS